MNGEQLYFQYLDNGPKDYADLLTTIYLSIGEKLFPLLADAESNNKRLSLKPVTVEESIGDLNESDVVAI